MKQMCKQKYPSPLSCRNKLSNPRGLTRCRASFTDYSKATQVRKFYPACTGVMDTNNITPQHVNDLLSLRLS